MLINHSPAISTMNHHESPPLNMNGPIPPKKGAKKGIKSRGASRMLRTFRATKLQWKMHHTWIPGIPWEHRGGDLGRPWNMGIWDENWAGKNIWKNGEKWGDGKNIWIMKTCFFFNMPMKSSVLWESYPPPWTDYEWVTNHGMFPPTRWQALIPQHEEDRTREKRYSWNTVCLFNVANWNITIFLIGKSSCLYVYPL